MVMVIIIRGDLNYLNLLFEVSGYVNGIVILIKNVTILPGIAPVGQKVLISNYLSSGLNLTDVKVDLELCYFIRIKLLNLIMMVLVLKVKCN